MDNKFIGLMVGLTVGVLMVSGFLWPIVSDATATEKTFENEGYFNLDKFTDNLTFTWNAETPDTFTVNGESVTYHNDTGLSLSVALGERFAVRLSNNNSAINFYGAGTYINTSATNPTFSLTYESGSVTVTNGAQTKTVADVTECYAINGDGQYVMKKSNSVAYLNSGSEIVADSAIYASGQTFSGSGYIFWHMAGTINDMDYPDSFDAALTVSNQEIHGEYSTECDDLYKLDNITFTATSSYQEGVTYNITASYFVVPAEVTAEKPWHLDTMQIAMIGVIGTLGAIVLIAAAAGSIRRLD